jgi:hypothetical protein
VHIDGYKIKESPPQNKSDERLTQWRSRHSVKNFVGFSVARLFNG